MTDTENPPLREFHAVADLFPLLRGRAFEELVEDIRKNGLREPILLDAEGRIIDGRNRYRACLAAGVEPRFVEWHGQGPLTDAALSLNLRRRHLDESQRAMVAARLAKLLEKQEPARGKGRPRKNDANLHHFSTTHARSQAAATVNVSKRLVASAVKVLQDGCDELIAAVESGAVAVSTAAALAGLPAAEQQAVVAAGPREAASKARELRVRAAPPEQRSPGRFGVVRVQPVGAQGAAGAVLFLWVEHGAMDAAIAALEARGFRYAPSAA